MKTARALLAAVRPRQWAKNVLLLAGLYFPESGGRSPLLFEPSAVLRAAQAFAVFCMLSGAIYLLNDAIDAPADRLHPKKRLRPIASGALSVRVALCVAACLAAGGLLWAEQLSRAFLLCSSAYFGMNLAYTLALKEVFLIDTMIISMGFILRSVSGVLVLRTPERYVELTSWFVICVLFLSLFVAFCKRRGELATLEGGARRHRRVLAEYTHNVLDQGIAMCASGAVLSYALYATYHPRPWMMLTTFPFVLFGILRYVHLVYTRGMGDAPEDALLGDLPLLGCIAMWGLALLLVFYP